MCKEWEWSFDADVTGSVWGDVMFLFGIAECVASISDAGGARCDFGKNIEKVCYTFLQKLYFCVVGGIKKRLML